MIQIRERTVGAVAVLDVSGRMVLAETESDGLLKAAVAEVVGRGHRLIVLNLAGVYQLDTAGLTALVGAYTTAVRGGARLRLAQPTKRMGELLQVTRLNILLETYETEEDAIASFACSSAVAC